VRDVLAAGTNVRYAGARVAARNQLNPVQDLYTSNDVRFVTAKLRGNKAAPKRGTFYITYIHPDVSYDLRREAGNNASWREAHVYASPDALYAGEIGAYEGQCFIETPRGKVFTDAGSSPTTADVYATVTCGQQALAEAQAIEVHVVQSPVVDRLRRFVSHGWYGLLGWGRFREAALYRTEATSTIGAN
jgi:N4-gp56 family major capsid protein